MIRLPPPAIRPVTPVRPGARRGSGFNSLELLIVVAVVGLVLALAIPPMLRMSSDLRVRMAAAELSSVLALARSTAVRHGTRVGVKFRLQPGGAVTYTLYRDGDGDGVRTRDIDRGIDPQLGAVRWLVRLGPQLGFGFPPGPPPTDPGNPRRRLDRLGDPIRFNRSDIASFDSLGTATPGSLYISDHRERLAVVRVHGGTGRIRVLYYDRESESWR